jgi:hypothetical protein
MADATQHLGLRYAHVDHGHLVNKGKNTHAQIDNFMASKGAPSGIATLDAYGDIPATQLDNVGIVPAFVSLHKAVGAISDRVGKHNGIASLDSSGSVLAKQLGNILGGVIPCAGTDDIVGTLKLDRGVSLNNQTRIVPIPQATHTDTDAHQLWSWSVYGGPAAFTRLFDYTVVALNRTTGRSAFWSGHALVNTDATGNTYVSCDTRKRSFTDPEDPIYVVNMNTLSGAHGNMTINLLVQCLARHSVLEWARDRVYHGKLKFQLVFDISQIKALS